jgi:putative heme-binding domain-containing protein
MESIAGAATILLHARMIYSGSSVGCVKRKIALLLLVAAGVRAQTEETPKNNPFTSPSDIERGGRLFAANCAPCHGPKGNGGRGANLARPKLPRAPDDRALFQTIRDGIPNTEMPGTWSMDDHETWQVAAFVRTLGRVAPEPVSGDAAAGAAVFRSKGCVGCHTVGTEGGRMGPALTEIGERRGAAYLRALVLDPASSLPEDFTMADLTTRAGARITGIVLNEDTYSIQVRDLTDRLHSFWKQDLAAMEKHTDRTPMPSFRGRVSDRELEDLVAYLVSLRGAQ